MIEGPEAARREKEREDGSSKKKSEHLERGIALRGETKDTSIVGYNPREATGTSKRFLHYSSSNFSCLIMIICQGLWNLGWP
ncbi:hypothetical protein QUC31_002760 [Theobroma cacao]